MYDMEFARIKKACDDFQQGQNSLDHLHAQIERIDEFRKEGRAIILNFVGHSGRIDLDRESSDRSLIAIREILLKRCSEIRAVMNRIVCPPGTCPIKDQAPADG